MNKRIGFIGGGNMGSAIIGGILESGLAAKEDIFVADLNQEGLNTLKEKWGVCITTDNIEVAKQADILFLSVKPNVYPIVIGQIMEIVKSETVIVSIAAGQTIENVQQLFGKEIKLIRAMPNTPALVGEGMSALSPNLVIEKEELEEVKQIFNSFGKCEIVPEALMETVIGVSGSSPAYVYMFIEAMADAAVEGGMQRAQAYRFAAQSVLGSAKMVLESGMHPGELKDMVCSPGGTTITAVMQLEKDGLRATVMNGTKACIEKAKEMKGK